MAVIHQILAKVQNEGVAKIFYGHPAILKTSLILNNRKVITSPKGSIVKISIKTMSSGKRILLSSRTADYDSVQTFIDEVGITSMQTASAREVPNGWTKTEKFDGDDDKSYLASKYVLPRFPAEKVEVAPIIEEEVEEQSDGFVHYGELYVPELVVRTLKAISSIANSNVAANVLLVGPSGNGKTSLAKDFADANGLSFTKVNCSVVRDPEEWFGYREAVDGSTKFVETEFTKRVKQGNAVILLDEINRLEPYLHNSLMPLLDETRSTTIHGEDIKVGTGTIFFCTMNMGTGFVGTFILDTAIKNRMDATVSMTKLSVEREVNLLVERVGIDREVATNIVRMLEKIRAAATRNEIDIDISPRSSLKIARMVNTSLVNAKEALTLVIFNNAESVEQAKLLIDSLIGG
jgi:MoxR-like ATPase